MVDKEGDRGGGEQKGQEGRVRRPYFVITLWMHLPI